MLEEGRKAVSVGQFIDLVNDALALIPNEGIVVVGEIVGHRISQGKWINFDLKDEEREAKVSCFATTFKIKTPLEDGMRVQIVGYPKVYERFGKFSMNVEAVEPVGEGALAKAYALIKAQLEKEGLFDPARKRELPRFPERIGLITSGEAAAYGDFLRILNNRWGGVQVVHTPVHVQGKNAVPEILQAFAAFEQMDEKPEVLVLTRGGGSLEDLHAFNDEQVARAVFQSSIPVVVGVGHERDESLCDFVADVRASTPSNAAEWVVPDRREVWREISASLMRMDDALSYEIDRENRRIESALQSLRHFMQTSVYDMQMVIDRFCHSFDRFRLSLVATRQHIETLTRLIKSYDVQKTLERGFSIVRAKGKSVRDASQLASGDELAIQFGRGSADATVK